MNFDFNVLKSKIQENMKTYTMIFALIAIWIIFGLLTDGIFFAPRNISNLFRQMTIISFLAVGMVLIIVQTNIDLSVGSVVGFVSAVAAFFQARIFPDMLPALFPDMETATVGILSTVLTVVISLLIGVLVGIFQGCIVAYMRVPAFIVTLGGMMIFRGGVLGVTRGKTIVPVEDSLRWIAQGYVPNQVGIVLALLVILYLVYNMYYTRNMKRKYGFKLDSIAYDAVKTGFFSFLVILYVWYMNQYKGIQNPVLLLAVVSVIVSYLATNTKFGRYTYAIGGNIEAARLSGVDIKKIVFLGFVLMGLLAGVAGLVLTGYVAAGTTGGGNMYELDTIAACVIGGTSLAGGVGTIFGAIIGSLVMASILNGMSIMNVDIFWQYIIKGLVLIIAVYVDVTQNKR